MGNTDFDRMQQGRQDMKEKDTRGQQQHKMWDGNERRMSERRQQQSSRQSGRKSMDPQAGQSR